VSTHLFLSDELGRYGFPEGHPLSVDRQGAFWRAARARGLDRGVELAAAPPAPRAAIELFHHPHYVDRVIEASRRGTGYLDYGDTPAFPGCYEVAAHVVGAALEGARRVVRGEAARSFQPIGGLHHARRAAAAGFCVFNDIGVLIEALRAEHGLRRIAYVDIDVHHGDGVFYEFEHDPDLVCVDIHESGAYLYPGTGAACETGHGEAEGAKLNLPLEPGAGDPLADLRLTPAAHAHAARRLAALAGRHAAGRLMAFGGGGYHLENLSAAWCAVLEALRA